jgi:hypothetical protein
MSIFKKFIDYLFPPEDIDDNIYINYSSYYDRIEKPVAKNKKIYILKREKERAEKLE